MKVFEHVDPFATPRSVTHEQTLKSVFDLTLLCAKRGFSVQGFMQYCLGSWAMCLEGEVAVYGCVVSALDSPTYGGKLSIMQSLAGDSFSQMMANTGLYAVLKPGAIAWVPRA